MAEGLRLRRQRFADLVVTHERRRDGGERLGVVIEVVGINAEQRAYPFFRHRRHRSGDDGADRAIDHGKRCRLRARPWR